MHKSTNADRNFEKLKKNLDRKYLTAKHRQYQDQKFKMRQFTSMLSSAQACRAERENRANQLKKRQAPTSTNTNLENGKFPNDSSSKDRLELNSRSENFKESNEMTQRIGHEPFAGKTKLEKNQISLFANANDDADDQDRDFGINTRKNNKLGQPQSPRLKKQREASLELRLNKEKDYADGTYYT